MDPRYKSVTDAGSDSYLLNEHHHSICRLSFVGELFLTICTGISTQFLSILSDHDKNICGHDKNIWEKGKALVVQIET